MKNLRLIGFVFCVALAGCATPKVTQPPGLVARLHGDFHHDTLALTWQPGFCSSGKGCLPDQPRTPLVGLHGLWASEPHTLEARGVPVQQWWREGCSLYDSDSSPPVLDNAMQASLSEIVPHTEHSLVAHEYTKHARCFGYPAQTFFATATELRLKFARSPVAQWMAERAGTKIRHDELLTFFDKATGNNQPRALQLQCEHDAQGRVVLTQMWFTLRHDRLNEFPAASAFLSSPENQDNCPAEFWLKRW